MKQELLLKNKSDYLKGKLTVILKLILILYPINQSVEMA